MSPDARLMHAVDFVTRHAPWLCEPEFGVCVVGSQALAHACRQGGVAAPDASDLDLSWRLDPEAGTALLQQHGVFVPTTTGNQQRGTLALKLDGVRIEITTFRAEVADADLEAHIKADLSERDMTIGAIAVECATGRVHDPFDGLQHFRERRIEPVGDPAARVREHAIRWLRYYRKAHELGFDLANSVRKLHKHLEPDLLLALPKEAIAGELRAILVRCASPGRCLLELHEAGLLAGLLPELALQFDGRPAGPQRWHPEVSQALHMILALEWAAANTHHLDERDRTATLFAVLCHDLGKGTTPTAELPGHRGHEDAGIPLIDAIVRRWPGLMDQRTATLCRHVSALHLHARRFDELRSGTLADYYERYFRERDYPLEPFALAVAADSAGRLGHEDEGAAVRDRVRCDLDRLRRACASVDAAAIRTEHGDDIPAFRAALHEARARAIRASGR